MSLHKYRGNVRLLTAVDPKQLIAQHGGKTSSAVSGKTDYLVAGEKAGSKLGKAEALGVTVLDEQGFEDLLPSGS